MRWMLNLGYLGLIAIAMPVLLYRMLTQGKYREGWREKLLGDVPERSEHPQRFWFHAVSVGEVNLLPGMIQRVRKEMPDVDVVVSTTTLTGMQVARRHFGDQMVFYAPLDFSWAVRRAIDRIKPRALILAELELWPNLIGIAGEHGTNVMVFNARLSDRSFQGYQRWRRFLRPMISGLSVVAAQDEQTAHRFVDLGVAANQVHVTGSVKFDGAPTQRNTLEVQTLRKLVAVEPIHKVWIAGSTINPEEQIALDVFQRLYTKHPNLRLILVPRHPERFDAVAELIQQSGLTCCRRSQLNSPLEHWPSNEIVLVDTIGELKHWWGLADYAFVGGSMGQRGGQNMLEPAGYGAAVCFGPDTRNFRDIANRLLDAGAAVRVADATELEAFINESLEHPDHAIVRGQHARQLVLCGCGATERTVELMVKQLSRRTLSKAA